MGRKNRYFSHVQPNLQKIPEWLETMTEAQIAARLGISVCSFEKYKTLYPELVEALQTGREQLCRDLKETLKKKARGFMYTETKTTQRKENGKSVVVVEKYEKYAQPDTGAIHLLLKNLDPEWTNDDRQTMEIKKKQIEIQQQKADAAEW